MKKRMHHEFAEVPEASVDGSGCSNQRVKITPEAGSESDSTRSYSSSVHAMRVESSKKKQCIFWTPEEDEALRIAVKAPNGQAKTSDKTWNDVALEVSTQVGRQRLDWQCQQRWNNILKQGTRKGRWTPDEDRELTAVVEVNLASNSKLDWKLIQEHIPGRNTRQCRERWTVFLDPTLNHGPWTPQENEQLLKLWEKMPKRWAQIAGHLKGRTVEATKTQINVLLRLEANKSRAAGNAQQEEKELDEPQPPPALPVQQPRPQPPHPSSPLPLPPPEPLESLIPERQISLGSRQSSLPSLASLQDSKLDALFGELLPHASISADSLMPLSPQGRVLSTMSLLSGDLEDLGVGLATGSSTADVLDNADGDPFLAEQDAFRSFNLLSLGCDSPE